MYEVHSDDEYTEYLRGKVPELPPGPVLPDIEAIDEVLGMSPCNPWGYVTPGPPELYMLRHREDGPPSYLVAIDGQTDEVYLCFTNKDIADAECLRQNDLYDVDTYVERVK